MVWIAGESQRDAGQGLWVAQGNCYFLAQKFMHVISLILFIPRVFFFPLPLSESRVRLLGENGAVSMPSKT